MKVLVTGGAGFIGSHIADALIEHGHQVVVVDNLATGLLDNVNPGAKFCKLSIRDAELANIFDQERPEIVNHQAAQTVITSSVGDPVFDAQENILGSLNVIINCARFGVRRIIYASSSGAIYGNPQYLPVDETHPINSLSPYGISKHTVEHYLYFYSIQWGLDYTVLRYANVYGPRQNPTGEAGLRSLQCCVDEIGQGQTLIISRKRWFRSSPLLGYMRSKSNVDGTISNDNRQG